MITSKTTQSIGAALLLMLAAGCATVEEPFKSELESAAPALKYCANWYQRLDAAIDSAGVRDAGGYRIPGFPYLRADRFSASFRDQVKDDPKAFADWVGRLKNLDAKAREYEIGNLPSRFFPLGGSGDAATALATTRNCAAQLANADLGGAGRRALLIARAKVPDNYSVLKRTLGLYPLARIPFWKGVDNWNREAEEMFRQARAKAGSSGAIVPYEPAARPAAAERIGAIFSRLQMDALGIPRFTDAERELLFDAYAPAFEIETGGNYDRFGPLSWHDGPAPEVDTALPLVYRRLAFTRFHGRVLAQLVYTIWFPERAPDGSSDIFAGRLDGVVFRQTLWTNGAPLIYDTIHPCGCYHLFFPTARLRPLPAPEAAMEWAFVPLHLPAFGAAQRVVVRIASRTHYVVDVRADSAASGTAYEFAEDDDLRALPSGRGRTRSAFGPDGIVAGTEREERFLYWPMGIDNAGAMRQWGTHATAFIGRRHFDDADLIERRFELSSGGQGALAHGFEHAPGAHEQD